MRPETPFGRRAWRNLPPLPAVAAKLLAALDNEKISLAEVSRLINMDAAFTAEVLRLANSSVFPIRFEVVNVPHAVTVLGLARVRGLVLTLALRDYLASMKAMRGGSRPGGIDDLVRRCWRHNLATALAGEALAARQWLDKSLAYTAGLLHDVGRLALIATDAERYSEVVNAAETGESLAAVERRLLGVDAAEARRTIIQTWNLPSALTGITCHQSIDTSIFGDAMAQVIGKGCGLACELGFAVAKPQPPADGAGANLDQAAADLSEQVLTRLNMFECEFMYAAL